MTADEDEQFALLSRLLVDYDEALASDTPSSLDASELAADLQLCEQWNDARQFLELVHQVRRRWSPSDALLDTPAWNAEPAPTPSADVPPQLGRFRIQHELGRGGLGVVYLAYDPALGRQVALKVPRGESLASAELRARFLREAEAAARLNHPHVVAVHDAGQDGRLCYIASELCAGPTLAQWLRPFPQGVPTEQAARIVQQLAGAVQHAHGRGVLHRDIKPSNILLTRAGETSVAGAATSEHEFLPKLTDFGMAKLLERDAEETRSGAIIGTAAYMAPEQAEGRVRELDARSDIYALGAVLYELLTGKRPHEGQSQVEILRHLLFEEPVAPRRLRPEIPRDLEAICLKCLARRRDDRYTTAQELADDLQRFLERRPTQARPLGTLERWLKWARRRPATAALTTVAVVAMVMLLSVSLVYSQRVATLLTIAEAERETARRAAALANERALEAQRSAYAADMHLAYENWLGSSRDTTLEILARHVPSQGQEDYRDFVWWYLKNLTEESVVLARHEGGVSAVAASPDGKTLATAGVDGQIRLWDAATQRLRSELAGHEKGQVNAMAFSPDGSVLASVGDDLPVRRWRVADGKQLAPLLGSRDWNADVLFTPDGQQIASCGGDQVIHLWDCATGEGVASLEGHQDTIGTMACTSRGVLFSASRDGQVRAWDLSTMAPDARLPGGVLRESSDRHVYDLALEASEGLLVGVFWDRSFTAWHVRSDNFGIEVDCPTDPIAGRSIASDAQDLLAIGTASGALDYTAGIEQAAGMMRTRYGHAARINGLAFVPGLHAFLSGSRDGTARLFPTVPIVDYEHQWREKRALDLRWRENLLISACFPKNVYCFDIVRKQQHYEASLYREQCKADVAAKTELVATIERNQILRVRRLHDKSEVWSCQLEKSSNHLAIDPAQRLVVATSGNKVIVHDLESGELVYEMEHPLDVVDMEFLPDSTLVCTTCQDGMLRVFDASNGMLLDEHRAAEVGVHELAVSYDGRVIATRADGGYRIWQREGWKLLGTVAEQAVPKSFDLLGPGDVLVIHLDTGLRFYRVSDGAELLDLAGSHPLDAMAVSPDGRRIATQKGMFVDFLDGRPSK